MGIIAPAATTILVVFLFVLLFVVAVKMLNGDILTDGMLSHESGGDIDPERLLMLIGTIMGAFAYLSYGLSKGAHDGALPDIPEELLTALGGGNLFYLSGKIFRNGGLAK
jgi:hypothetical protein